MNADVDKNDLLSPHTQHTDRADEDPRGKKSNKQIDKVSIQRVRSEVMGRTVHRKT